MKQGATKHGWLEKAEKVLRSFVPLAQDAPRERGRKIAFFMALLVFIGTGYYLIDDLWVQPQKTKATANTLREWFYAEEGEDAVFVPEGEDTTVYPDGMLPQFKRLYYNNNDVRGWLTFSAGEGDNDIFGGFIDNPVAQTADNDYYLNHDFWGGYDKAGTLFFDYRNDLNAGAVNRNLIIYGHNLTNELMFSRFNRLTSAQLERGRLLTTLRMDTLYEQRTYKVFAVMVLNVNEDEGPTFNYIRTKFSEESSFMAFVNNIRRRSLYDFGDVDVREGDELLTLSTCSNKSNTTLKDGRVVVVARRVREGEDPTVDPMKTTINDDVLMPMAWYINKGLEVPEEYRHATTTTPTKGTTTLGGVGSTTRPTTPSDGVTDPTAPPTVPGNPTSSTSDAAAGTDPTTPSSGGETTTPSGEGDGTTTSSGDGGEGTTTSSGDGGEGTTTSSDDSGEGTTTSSDDSGEDTTTSSEVQETTTTTQEETTTTTETQETTAPSTEGAEAAE